MGYSAPTQSGIREDLNLTLAQVAKVLLLDFFNVCSIVDVVNFLMLSICSILCLDHW